MAYLEHLLKETRPRKSEPRTVQNPTWDTRQVPVPKYLQKWPYNHINKQDELQDACDRLGFLLWRGKYEKSLLIINHCGGLGFFLRKEPCQQEKVFYSTCRERVYKVFWGHFCSFRTELLVCFWSISFCHLKTSHIGFCSCTTQLSSFMRSLFPGFFFFIVPSTCLIFNGPYMLL